MKHFQFVALSVLIAIMMIGCNKSTTSEAGVPDSATDTGTDSETVDAATDSVVQTDSTPDTGTGSDTDTWVNWDTDSEVIYSPRCYPTAPGNADGCVDDATEWLCKIQADACSVDEGCVAMELCMDSDCKDLDDTDWTACHETCAAANSGAELWKELTQCIFCERCSQDCSGEPEQLLCDYIPGACDGASDSCYGGPDDSDIGGCWGCAMAADCRDETEACSADTDCSALETCVHQCNLTLTGDAWTQCNNDCRAQYSAGVVLLAAYHSCVYCDACPMICLADAAGKCI